MKIHVWKRYTENRADEPIEEGIYEQSDQRLQGLARYLIDNGNARIYVEAPQVVEVVATVAAAPQEVIPDWPRIEDEARELTVENDKIRKINAKPKRARKAKS